jgi:phage terminase large subunit GpA-like protein
VRALGDRSKGPAKVRIHIPGWKGPELPDATFAVPLDRGYEKIHTATPWKEKDR